MESKSIDDTGDTCHRTHAFCLANSDNGEGDADGYSPRDATMTTNNTHEAGTPGTFDTRPIEAALQGPIAGS